VPQCLPALSVLAIFSFRDSWDQFLWPLTVVSIDALRTYPLGLVQFGEEYRIPPLSRWRSRCSPRFRCSCCS
jgi:multiple sugar transport system permease protein